MSKQLGLNDPPALLDGTITNMGLAGLALYHIFITPKPEAEQDPRGSDHVVCEVLHARNTPANVIPEAGEFISIAEPTGHERIQLHKSPSNHPAPLEAQVSD